MRQISDSETRMNLIVTLWGLLFTKCFILEYLVRHYGVPVDSRLYVWALSIVMATVATAVYAELHKNARAQLLNKAGFAIACLLGLIAGLFVLAGLTAPDGQAGAALALAAFALAVKHAWLSRPGTGAGIPWKALGWLAAAIASAYLGAPSGFLVFALAIVGLTVVPGFIRFLVWRREKRSSAPESTANS